MTTAHLPMIEAAALAVADYAIPVAAKPRLKLPAGVMPFQLNWPYIIVIGGYHAAALLAFMPGYFSWSGFILAILGTAGCLASTFAIIVCSPIAA